MQVAGRRVQQMWEEDAVLQDMLVAGQLVQRQPQMVTTVRSERFHLVKEVQARIVHWPWL